MNKKFVIFLCVLCVLCIKNLFAQTATIRELSGTVELQRAGSQNWVPARAGDRIEQNTVISTGFKSTAVLVIGSSTINVRPITRLSLKELTVQNETETTNISLNTGRVRVEVKPPAGSRANTTIQTTTATASVRGTTFEMDTVSLKVTEGAVSFAPAGSESKAVTVTGGQSTKVDTETGTAVSPVITAQEERSLPSLAGQSSVTGTESGSIFVDPRGSLIIKVDLEIDQSPK